MRYIRLVVNILLLLTTPTIIAQPCTPHYERSIQSVSLRPDSRIPNFITWTYDEIVDWIELLESGELDDYYDESEIPAVNEFLIKLIRAATLIYDVKDELELEKDIEELLASEDPYSLLSSYESGTDSPLPFTMVAWS